MTIINKDNESVKQAITAIPFGSKKGMTLKRYEGEVLGNVEKTITLNEKIVWIDGEKKTEGYVDDENHMLIEHPDRIEVIAIPYGSLIEHIEDKEDKENFIGILFESDNNYDIRYDAADMQMYHSNIYKSSFIPEIGKMPKINLAGAMDIEIESAKGIIDGIGFQFLSKLTVSIEKGGAFPRIDSVVLQKDQAERKISIVVIKGEEAEKPKPPMLTTDTFGKYELLICNVSVKANALAINISDIEDKRIVLYNVYGADYIISNDWDFRNLCEKKIKTDTVLLIANVESYDYVIDGFVKTIKTVNASKISGNITVKNAVIENIEFKKGKVNLFSCSVKNAAFAKDCEMLETSSSKFEKCVIDSKVNFQKSPYIDNGIVGEIKSFAGIKDKIPEGWLVCDGSSLGRETYKELFSVLGETWGNGDGSSTFNIPDGRGGVLKCVGASEGGFFKDDDAENRTNTKNVKAGDVVGSYQRFAFEKHKHNIQVGAQNIQRASFSSCYVSGSGIKIYTDEIDAVYSSGKSTRDNNIGVYFIIKAK